MPKTYIDPPGGWLYGFPKLFTKGKAETLDSWLVRNGYPREEIERGMAKYCRYWSEVEDDA